jgi:hypothetical protein
MTQQIAIANVGWSELYEDDGIVGDHAFLRDNGWGAERYNFSQDRDGNYNIYVRPVGSLEAAPAPRDPDNWLIVLVSKKKNKPGLYIVGWFEDASFLPTYRDRPEYDYDPSFRLTPGEGKYHFNVKARSGFRVPELLRDVRLDSTAMRRTSIMYLRGHGKHSDSKEALAISVLAQIKKLREVVRLVGNGDPQEANGSQKLTTTDTARRREVELAAMTMATEHFEEAGFVVEDVSKENRGYDLFASDPEDPNIQRFVEVKGTQADRPRFLLSRREQRFMDDPVNTAGWRLLVVTSALAKPQAHEYTCSEVRRSFELSPFTWFGEEKK